MQEAERQGTAANFDLGHWGRVLEPRLTRLYEAIAEIDLYGSGEAKDRVHGWDGPANFAVSTRPGGAFGRGIRAAVEGDARDFRDPFVDLIRMELGISD